MASDEGDEGTRDRAIRRQVSRTIGNWLLGLVSLALISAWGATGIYQLEPGESAVLLRLGRYVATVTSPGLHWHWPPPLEYAETVNLTEVRREKFGIRTGQPAVPGEETASFENAIQTADSNIVNLSYVVQYHVANPFLYVYGMATPADTLRDAAQAAVREVVGRRLIDEVHSSKRAEVQNEARETLQQTLDAYFPGESPGVFEIETIELQIVQPPPQVQDAFDDVNAAQRDGDRAASVALGDAREIRERASAQATEIREAALAYKTARIVESRGEAERFAALQREYARAPEVTRRRLYLETMESVLPEMEKYIVKSNSVNLLPGFPMLPAPPARGE